MIGIGIEICIYVPIMRHFILTTVLVGSSVGSSSTKASIIYNGHGFYSNSYLTM